MIAIFLVIKSNIIMKIKIVGMFLILISILGGMNLLFLDDISNSKQIKKSKIRQNKIIQKNRLIINELWREDYDRLLKSGKIPIAWVKVNKVIYIPTDSLTAELSAYLKAPLLIVKNGDYRLEVTVISHISENGKTQILLQQNIIDIQNENTVWEMNKTYNLYSGSKRHKFNK